VSITGKVKDQTRDGYQTHPHAGIMPMTAVRMYRERTMFLMKTVANKKTMKTAVNKSLTKTAGMFLRRNVAQ